MDRTGVRYDYVRLWCVCGVFRMGGMGVSERVGKWVGDRTWIL